MDLIIDKTKNLVTLQESFKKCYAVGTINCAIGNLITILENYEPPEVKQGKYAEYIVKEVGEHLAALRANTTLKPQTIGDIPISSNDFIEKCLLFDNENEIRLSLETIEHFRIKNRIKVFIYPLSRFDNLQNEMGLRAENIRQVLDIIYSLLYYYALNGYNLKRCEHCGRWFATKTFKQKYCPRKSLFPEYEDVTCSEAANKIFTNIQNQHRTIKKWADNYFLPEDEIMVSFSNDYKKIKESRRSVENLTNAFVMLEEYKRKFKENK